MIAECVIVTGATQRAIFSPRAFRARIGTDIASPAVFAEAISVHGVARTIVLAAAVGSTILTVSSIRARIVAQGSVPTGLAGAGTRDWIAGGLIATFALLKTGEAVRAFRAGQIAVETLPSSCARTTAVNRIALGAVQTRAAIATVGTPFILGTGNVASGSAVAWFAFALVRSHTCSMQALFAADRHATAVISRPRVAQAAVFEYSRLFNRLSFVCHFVMDRVSGAPRREGEAGCECAHFVRLHVGDLDGDKVFFLTGADVWSRQIGLDEGRQQQ